MADLYEQVESIRSLCGIDSLEPLFLRLETRSVERLRQTHLHLAAVAIENGLPVEKLTPEALINITNAMITELQEKNTFVESARRVLQARIAVGDGEKNLDWETARETLENPVTEEEVTPVRRQMKTEADERLRELAVEMRERRGTHDPYYPAGHGDEYS